MASTADFKTGMTIRVEGTLYSLVQFQHVKPGKGGAFVRTKLKNVVTGAVVERTFRAGESIEIVRTEERQCQLLYREADLFHFMDGQTYEQFALGADMVGDDARFLGENQTVSILTAGDKMLGVRLPIFVELVVAKTDPGLRGDTATGGSKPAVLETGGTVQVPLFINEGDRLKIDTRTGEYVERAA